VENDEHNGVEANDDGTMASNTELEDGEIVDGEIVENAEHNGVEANDDGTMASDEEAEAVEEHDEVDPDNKGSEKHYTNSAFSHATVDDIPYLILYKMVGVLWNESHFEYKDETDLIEHVTSDFPKKLKSMEWNEKANAFFQCGKSFLKGSQNLKTADTFDEVKDAIFEILRCVHQQDDAGLQKPEDAAPPEDGAPSEDAAPLEMECNETTSHEVRNYLLKLLVFLDESRPKNSTQQVDEDWNGVQYFLLSKLILLNQSYSRLIHEQVTKYFDTYKLEKVAPFAQTKPLKTWRREDSIGQMTPSYLSKNYAEEVPNLRWVDRLTVSGFSDIKSFQQEQRQKLRQTETRPGLRECSDITNEGFTVGYNRRGELIMGLVVKIEYRIALNRFFVSTIPIGADSSTRQVLVFYDQKLTDFVFFGKRPADEKTYQMYVEVFTENPSQMLRYLEPLAFFVADYGLHTKWNKVYTDSWLNFQRQQHTGLTATRRIDMNNASVVALNTHAVSRDNAGLHYDVYNNSMKLELMEVTSKLQHATEEEQLIFAFWLEKSRVLDALGVVNPADGELYDILFYKLGMNPCFLRSKDYKLVAPLRCTMIPQIESYLNTIGGLDVFKSLVQNGTVKWLGAGPLPPGGTTDLLLMAAHVYDRKRLLGVELNRQQKIVINRQQLYWDVLYRTTQNLLKLLDSDEGIHDALVALERKPKTKPRSKGVPTEAPEEAMCKLKKEVLVTIFGPGFKAKSVTITEFPYVKSSHAAFKKAMQGTHGEAFWDSVPGLATLPHRKRFARKSTLFSLMWNIRNYTSNSELSEDHVALEYTKQGYFMHDADREQFQKLADAVDKAFREQNGEVVSDTCDDDSDNMPLVKTKKKKKKNKKNNNNESETLTVVGEASGQQESELEILRLQVQHLTKENDGLKKRQRPEEDAKATMNTADRQKPIKTEAPNVVPSIESGNRVWWKEVQTLSGATLSSANKETLSSVVMTYVPSYFANQNNGVFKKTYEQRKAKDFLQEIHRFLAGLVMKHVENPHASVDALLEAYPNDTADHLVKMLQAVLEKEQTERKKSMDNARKKSKNASTIQSIDAGKQVVPCNATEVSGKSDVIVLSSDDEH
jgi:hypothetical protein